MLDLLQPLDECSILLQLLLQVTILVARSGRAILEGSLLWSETGKSVEGWIEEEGMGGWQRGEANLVRFGRTKLLDEAIPLLHESDKSA